MVARTTAHATLTDTLARAERSAASGTLLGGRAFATGFTPLDTQLDGGIRVGELMLIGGAQAIGKTTFALQMARNVLVADADVHVVYACYEHPAELLLERLLALESGSFAGPDGVTLRDIRVRLGAGTGRTLRDRLGDDESVVHALKAAGEYGDRLHLVTASGGRTGVDELRQVLAKVGGAHVVLVVDYLQKVCASDDLTAEAERVTQVVGDLKDLALEHPAAVVAIVATDSAGVGPGRTRMHHFRGSTALLYEADVVLTLNNKWDIVARHHLVYGTSDVERFRDYAIVSVEKNRNGEADLDLEFRTRFAHASWEPEGAQVRERLVDDRIYTE